MIKNLFIKPVKGSPLTAVQSLECTVAGIKRNAPCSLFRHVLILPQSTLDTFELPAGQLRENVIVDYPTLHDLESGTVLRLGSVSVRLTFHCEPCGRVVDKVRASSLLHRRGYLGQIVEAGTMTVGNAVISLGVRYESIPYAVKERLQWALARQQSPVKASDLLYSCGIPVCYSRALPRLLKTLPAELAKLVVFESHKTTNDKQMVLV